MLSGLHYRVVRTCGPILLLIAGIGTPAVLAADLAAKVDFSHAIVPILKHIASSATAATGTKAIFRSIRGRRF